METTSGEATPLLYPPRRCRFGRCNVTIINANSTFKEFNQNALLLSMAFGQKMKNLTSANKDIIGKAAEGRKFQLRSTFR